MLPVSEPRPMQVATRTDAEPGPAPTFCDLSVIIPIHNEEENVGPLLAELREVLDGTRLDYELLFIDDGSTDQSLERLRAAAAHCPRVVILELRRNFGQTAAIAAGFDYSRGRVIIPMDGDLQNDPRDIPALLAKLEGPPRCDIVSGWRKNRHDRWLTRKVPSSLANALIRKVTGVRIHDFGCTLKVYRREVLEGVSFFSELHRFLPALAVWHGAHITEMEVNHRPRTRGRTKYGLGRTVRVLLDLVTVKFLGTYMTKPLYFFGKLAMWTLILALVLLGVAIGQKYGHFGHPDGLNLNRNVLVPLAALLCSFAVQCVLFGIVAELLVRVYHESRGRPVYRLRHVHHHPGRRPPESSGAR